MTHLHTHAPVPPLNADIWASPVPVPTIPSGYRFNRDVPYVPTDEQVALAMLKFARVGPADVVYDLGCGDGRIVCTAVRHFGARAVGVDIDPQRIRECDESLRHLPPQDRKFARFILGSFFDLDLTECSVLTLYLLPKINVKLRPKLLWELRPGARIIANTFSMGDWEPDDVLETHHRTLYKWVVPAWLQGKWKAVIDAPPSLGGRRKLTLELERRFQILTGKAWVFGKSVPLGTGRIRGHAFSFRLPDPTLGRGLTLSGVMDGPHLRGTWALDNNEAAGPWGARRDPA